MSERLGLGGGCHWCTEAVFQSLRGVDRVEQGFIRAMPPDEAFSEAVLLHFDPAEITLTDLIDIHLRTHASTSAHKLRGKYRSAVYVFSAEQAAKAMRILGQLQQDFDAPLVTRVLDFAGFAPSESRYLDYHEKHAGKPFCTRYIDPKLGRLRAAYAHLMR